MERCKRCGDWLSNSQIECRCKRFEYRALEWLGDDWQEIYAYDAEEAARLAGEKNDDERSLIDDDVEIDIRDSEGVVTTYSVSAEVDVDYYAREKK